MNTAASVLLFWILHVVILFFFWFNFTLWVSQHFWLVNPYSLGVFTALPCNAFEGRTEGHSVSASLLTSRRGQGLRSQLEYPRHHTITGHHSCLFAFDPKTPWVLDFTFYPVLKGSPSIDLRAGPAWEFGEQKMGWGVAQNQLFPKVINSWPWQGFMLP